ncbi:MAG: T9SS type A sorting domain-containing protein [Ignavibacteria bacterium]|nr:T9SS type A sorting domain-containing protein [Ignavibacteria bacterium]
MNTGYVVSQLSFNSAVLKTTNSGESWINISSVNGLKSYDLDFINQNTGFICGLDDMFFSKIFKTTNSGLNWIDCNIQEDFAEFFDIHFINSNTGFCVGEVGKIYKTTNAGNNWTKLNNPSTNDLIRNIFFLNDNTGWFSAGAETGSLYRTTNCGLNWQYYIYGFHEIHSTHFFNDSVGLGCGTNGHNSSRFYRTTNGGANWTVSQFANVIVLETVIMISNLNGWLSGLTNDLRGNIYRTTNGGNNWVLQFSSTEPMPLTKLYAYDSSNVWGISNNGKILKYGDLTGINPISSEIPIHFSLYQNYPNPFNPSTKIKFQIPLMKGVSGEAGQLVTPGREGVFTSLRVFDILGREVRSLVNENLNPGIYEADFNAADLPSGVYFYKLQAGEFIDTKKMILIK